MAFVRSRAFERDDRVGDEGLGVSHDSVTEISTFVEVGADATHRGERESKKVTFFKKGNIFKTKRELVKSKLAFLSWTKSSRRT